MEADEEVRLFPAGHRWALIRAAWLKHVLANVPMTAAERLETLRSLNALAGGHFTAGALAAVEPCCSTSFQMINEALGNDPGEHADATGFHHPDRRRDLRDAAAPQPVHADRHEAVRIRCA